MDEKHQSRLAPVLVALLLVLPLGSYVAGYFWLGEYKAIKTGNLLHPTADPGIVVLRVYRFRWLALAYRPAGKIEHYLRGVDVYTTTDST